MEDIISSSINFDREDFELEASNVRTKIQTYFTQLIEVIRQRQSQLTSELDEIISHYRLERIRVRGKVNELEKMKKFHEDLRFSSSIGDIHSELLSKIDSELTQLKHNSSMTVEFEWTREFARNANKIGKLTRIPSNILFSNLPQIDEVESDVTMKNTDSNKFIFSKRLYEGLIYKTDVGPIPRDSYCEEHLRSTFTEYSNWRVVIEGCYWCGKANILNQYIYVCDKRCYSCLHEWCRMKLFEFCRDSLCMYPGCEMLSLNDDCKFCSESHQQTLERDYRTIQSINTGKLGLKNPYWYSSNKSNQLITSYFSESPTVKKITKYFPKAGIQDATPNLTESSLSAFNSLSKQSTFIESPSKHKNPFK